MYVAERRETALEIELHAASLEVRVVRDTESVHLHPVPSGHGQIVYLCVCCSTAELCVADVTVFTRVAVADITGYGRERGRGRREREREKKNMVANNTQHAVLAEMPLTLHPRYMGVYRGNNDIYVERKKG